MDVESQQTLNEAVDRAHQAGDEVVDRADSEISAAIASALKTLLDGVQSALSAATADVAKTIASLDGWTLQITVPPVTIRLTKPQ